jgi:hypothetical protein
MRKPKNLLRAIRTAAVGLLALCATGCIPYAHEFRVFEAVERPPLVYPARESEPNRVDVVDAQTGQPIPDAHAVLVLHRAKASGICCASYTPVRPAVRVEPAAQLGHLSYYDFGFVIAPGFITTSEYTEASVIVVKAGYLPLTIDALVCPRTVPLTRAASPEQTATALRAAVQRAAAREPVAPDELVDEVFRKLPKSVQ